MTQQLFLFLNKDLNLELYAVCVQKYLWGTRDCGTSFRANEVTFFSVQICQT